LNRRIVDLMMLWIPRGDFIGKKFMGEMKTRL
jgi:hypothetical protein